MIGPCVENMREIPAAYELCQRKKEYSFFADWIANSVVDAEQSVFEKKVEQKRFEIVREETISAVVAQNYDSFEKNYIQFEKLVCWIADGKREDACFYFCTAVRLLDERLQELQLKRKSMEMKELLEVGRKCSSYAELTHTFREIFEEYLQGIQQLAVSSDKQSFIRAKEYIEKHYNEDLTLNILANEVHMNPYYFSAFFKKNAGENFKDYVSKVRIDHAVPLLVSSNKKAYEIAIEVGFSDTRTFSDAFQKLYNETPNAYRKRIRSQ